MPSIFFSYRRSDAPGHAGRLYDRFAARFGEPNVFMDVGSTGAGEDYVDVMTRRVAGSDALIAVIGRDWLRAKRDRMRRLEDPSDPVRFEISTALANRVPVIPVLVQGARMPTPADLPDEIRALAHRNAVVLSETAWTAQVNALLDSVEASLQEPASTPRPASIPLSPRAHEDYTIDVAVGHGAISPTGPPPDSLDLREPWHSIGNQGRVAAPVGWAIADSVVRWQLVQTGRLGAKELLSSRFIWMAAKEIDAGRPYPGTFLEDEDVSLKSGLDVARRFGVALETELPWEGGAFGGSPKTLYASASARRINSYFNLSYQVHDRDRVFTAWRRWISQQGPVVVLLAMDRHLVAGERLQDFDADSVEGRHAAALLGYGPDHFLVRSSWGRQWGDAGYAKLGLDYAAAAFIESYGVVV
jgi:TIR domain/Papain family cysteine protease